MLQVAVPESARIPKSNGIHNFKVFIVIKSIIKKPYIAITNYTFPLIQPMWSGRGNDSR